MKMLKTMILSCSMLTNFTFAKVFDTKVSIGSPIEIASSKSLGGNKYQVNIKFSAELASCADFEGMLFVSQLNGDYVFTALASDLRRNDPNVDVCAASSKSLVINESLILNVDPKGTLLTINDQSLPLEVKKGKVIIRSTPDTVMCPYGMGVNASTGMFMSCDCPDSYPYYNEQTGLCQDIPATK